MKFLKITLKLTKYLFIISILILITVIIIFVKYSKKLDYSMPDKLTITVLDNNDEYYFEINNANKQSYINIYDIDKDIINSFISIEDKNFYKHKGIDIKRIIGAFLNNIKSNSLSQGASTITQQYARNLYLSNEKTYKRKLEEISIAINLETKYTKDQILEGYLNTIYFGHGLYGIQDACKFYFNKEASNVSIAEAAVLAAIPKGPSLYSPISNFNNNKKRKELIINELYKDNKITLSQKNHAMNEIIKIYGQSSTVKIAPYYQDTVVNELKKLNISSSVPYTVYTNLDNNLHNIINDTIYKYKPNSDMQIAVVAMNPQNGAILDIIGGYDYQTSTLNRATSSLRQPGSSIKPFLYYAALENGFTPITTFNSSKTSFHVDGKIYEPKNYKDIYPNQDVTMLYALATSDNIYAVKTHLFLGTNTLVKTLKDFGFTSKINNNASLALGTSEVYLKELVEGYSKIASLGKDVKSNIIKKIVDINGKVLYQTSNNYKQRFDKENCYILSEAMTNIFDNRLSINISVTGASLKSMISKKYAAKSGSTDTDNWMIGYNNNIVLGVWCGYDDNRLIEQGNGTFIKYIWAEIMEKYTTNLKNNWYETPSNVTSIVLNPTTGKIAQDNQYSKNIYFNINNIPWYIFDLDEFEIEDI